MLRFGQVLSLLAILSLACEALSVPALKMATAVSQVGTQVPALDPSSLAEVPTQNVDELPELRNSALVDVYDPVRNPAEDLKWAVIFAQRENKRIMLELGAS